MSGLPGVNASVPRMAPAMLAGAVAAGCVFLAGIALDIGWLRLLSKPVPVLLFALWLWRAGHAGSRHWVIAGLVFSLAGDVLLELNYLGLRDDRLLFIAGLGAFFVAHVLYLAYFLGRARTLHLARYLPFAAWGVILWLLTFRNMGGLLVPVTAYILVITCMMWRANCLVDGQGRAVSLAQSLGWGAVIFGISDSLIAINMFLAPFDAARYAIILTYWVGQYGITVGTVAQESQA